MGKVLARILEKTFKKKSAKKFAKTLTQILVILLSIFFTLLIYLPASWFAYLLEQQSAGRVRLGEVDGTFWHGSAVIGAAAAVSSDSAGFLTPLLPGRFTWRIAPKILVGQLNVQLENPSVLAQPIVLQGDWRNIQISAGTLALSADYLAGLGAPLNTLQFSGPMRLSWNALQIAPHSPHAVNGRMTLQMDRIASRLSPLRPLGSYRVTLNWRGQRADLNLMTEQGPLLLEGAGAIERGRLRFLGTAQAAPGFEEPLANLLHLLGRRRSEAGKEMVVLSL